MPKRRTREQERAYKAAYRKRAYLQRGPVRIDSVGVHRRLQALVALGWPGAEISRRAGRGHSWVLDTLKERKASRTKHAFVARLYEELRNEEPPTRDRVERRNVSLARMVALRNGWLPPDCWTPDTIDDPDARPNLLCLAGDVEGRPFELRAELALQLHAHFYPHEMTRKEIAERSGIATVTLRKLLREEAA